MRKVLFMSYALKIGGTAQVLSTILQYLDRSAFEPVLVTYTDERGYPIPSGISEHVLGIHGGGGLIHKLAVNFAAVLRLRRILRKEQPEVVVGMGAMSNWALILAAKLSHGEMVLIIGEHGIGGLEQRSDRVTSKLIGFLNRFLYPFADRIISISEGVREYLVRDLNIPENKIVSITNPIDVENIRKLSREPVEHPWLLHKDKPVILWIGRIEELKGVEYLIGAFERVLREIDARLIIVGDGSRRQRMQDLVIQKGLQEKVHFAGYQRNQYCYMPRSDVFAFSSIGGEGFGLVLVEAMACGLPVVSTDCVAGPAEILENGTYGILVPVADDDSLAKGILQILADPALRERLVSAGARRVSDFEPAKVVASYERLFREVCSDDSYGNSLVNQQ